MKSQHTPGSVCFGAYGKGQCPNATDDAFNYAYGYQLTYCATYRRTLLMTAGGFSAGPALLGRGEGWIALGWYASSLPRTRFDPSPARGSCLQFLKRLAFTLPIAGTGHAHARAGRKWRR